MLASIAVVVASPAVLAQESGGDETVGATATVLGVDTRTEPVAYVRTDGDPGDASVIVNGEEATAEATIALAASGQTQYTALVVDTSDLAAEDDLLAPLVNAALDYVQGAPANEEFTIVTSGGAARLEAGMTPNHERISTELAALVGAGRTATFDAIALAIDQFDDLDPAAIRNVVVFTATSDNQSSLTPAAVRGDALTDNANVYVVTVGGVDAGPLERIATSSGGRYVDAVDPTQVDPAAETFRTLVDNTYVIRFGAEAVASGGTLVISIAGQQLPVTFHEGSVTRGSALAVAPPVKGPGFLQDNVGLLLGIGLGFVAAALAAYAVASLMQQEDDALGDILDNYSGAAARRTSEDGDRISRSLRENPLFKRAVSITNQFAEDRGFLPRVEAKLEQSDVPLRAAEALTFYVGAVAAGGVIGLLLGRSMVSALVGLIFGCLLPPAFLSFKAKRRIKKFVSQLPDTLQLLSSTLKAGYSFMQGVEAVSKEIEDPMGEELRRVVTEAQLGRPVEDALDASAERMGSDDFAWAVMAVRIQREVGGNLAELLLTVAETMTARERLRREVSALTAEGRMSAIILGALPVGLAVIMYTINPAYTGLLFSHSLGNIMLGVAVVAALIGFVWMKKIIDIKI